MFCERLCPCVRGGRRATARKSDLSSVVQVLEALDQHQSRCLYMGDTNTGMQTSLKAGLDAAGAAWGFRSREELAAYHPKYLADHPLEIAKMLGI